MNKVFGIILVLAVVGGALMGCSSDDGDNGDIGSVDEGRETQMEQDTGDSEAPSGGAHIDGELIGTWAKYDGDVVVHSKFLVISDDSIERVGRDIRGGKDGIVYAQNGQIYVDFYPDQSEAPMSYGYDYTLADGNNTMYFVEDRTDEYTEPGIDTTGVMVLKRQ
ncbi:MAG: hypothetical protein R6U89_05940 [Dehalococcoidia bacterium]